MDGTGENHSIWSSNSSSSTCARNPVESKEHGGRSM
uniref:Uncharacterized protein n=1 Tax=Arundo donax TaxID=35708 RepID=A0A0A9AR20_ARUDO